MPAKTPAFDHAFWSTLNVLGPDTVAAAVQAVLQRRRLLALRALSTSELPAQTGQQAVFRVLLQWEAQGSNAARLREQLTAWVDRAASNPEALDECAAEAFAQRGTHRALALLAHCVGRGARWQRLLSGAEGRVVSDAVRAIGTSPVAPTESTLELLSALLPATTDEIPMLHLVTRTSGLPKPPQLLHQLVLQADKDGVGRVVPILQLLLERCLPLRSELEGWLERELQSPLIRPQQLAVALLAGVTPNPAALTQLRDRRIVTNGKDKDGNPIKNSSWLPRFVAGYLRPEDAVAWIKLIHGLGLPLDTPAGARNGYAAATWLRWAVRFAHFEQAKTLLALGADPLLAHPKPGDPNEGTVLAMVEHRARTHKVAEQYQALLPMVQARIAADAVTQTLAQADVTAAAAP